MIRILCFILLSTLVACNSMQHQSDEVSDSSNIQISKQDMEIDQRIDQEIPHEINASVQKWVDYFQGRGHRHMRRYLGRSSRYLPLMKQILREEGLPEDLVYVALIESGFRSSAVSHANAVGYWQFIRGTGSRYGLRINAVLDERQDFVLATRAAAKYLKSLHLLFDDWYLAIASYNVGENRVKRMVMRYHTRSFWDLARMRKLPRETRNYVPKFLAARMIGKNPEKYGFTDVDYQPELQFETLEYSKPINIRKLATHANISLTELKSLNPALKTDYAPLDRDGKLRVKVPAGKLLAATTATEISKVDNVSRMKRMLAQTTGSYKVRRGDTLGHIARKYRTSVRNLRNMNRLGKRSFIRVGQRLKVPMSGARAAKAVKSRKRVVASVSKGEKIHRVRKGETLSHIAERYGIGLSKLLRANRLSMRSRIAIGQKLIVPGQKNDGAVKPKARKTGSNSHKVRRGDTLIGIANDNGISLSKLLRINNLSKRSKIFIGQKIKLRGANRSISGNQYIVHNVKRGETLTHIASRYALGLTKLAQFNGLSSRHHLQIGEKLKIPQ
ncbi:MAG: LysM peptidoglycan-binding domain-containing protein [Bdellovibrionales bacterium]